MNHELIFSAVGLTAFAGWGALALAPLRRPLMVAGARLAAVALALAYAAILAASWGAEPKGNFSSFAGITLLFSEPGHLLAGWTHFLAFDLFVGAWAVGEAGKRGIPHLAMIPCLALTFLYGPVGLLLFLAVRHVFGLRSNSAPRTA
jgi:hypothetical protein